MPTNTDISDSNLSNLSPTNFYTVSSIKIDDMNRLRCSLRHWFNDHVVLRIGMNHIVQ